MTALATRLGPGFLALVLALGLGANPQGASAQPAEPLLSRAQALEEIGLAARVITRLHPGAFRHLSEIGFAELARATQAEVAGPQTRDDMFLHLSRLLAAVCDEHTQVHGFDLDAVIASGAAAGPHRSLTGEARPVGLAMNLLLLGERLVVAPGSGDLPVGAEIAAIDDRPAAELVPTLKDRLPVDGCAAARKVTAIGISGQEVLSAILGPGPTYSVALKPAGGGKEQSHRVSSLSVRDVMPRKTDGAAPGSALGDLGLVPVTQEDGLTLAIDPVRSVAYLAIDSFFDPSDAAIARIMRRMIGLGARRLILDLQDNTGGRVEAMRRAVSFLLPTAHRFSDAYELRSLELPEARHFRFADGKRPQFARDVRQFARGRHSGGVYLLPAGERAYGNPHFAGPVTVLMNELTGSAAAVAAFILKQELGALLVGTESHASGAYTCGRALGHYVMPHSGLRLYVPHACARRDGPLARAYERTILPDIEVLPRPETLARHRLEVIEAALIRLGQEG